MKNQFLSAGNTVNPYLEGLFQWLINGIFKFLSPLFKVLTLLLLTLFLTSGLAAQTKTVKKMQTPIEYPHYDQTWYKETKSALKKALKDARKANRENKKANRRAQKLASLRDKISEISGSIKKGGSEL